MLVTGDDMATWLPAFQTARLVPGRPLPDDISPVCDIAAEAYTATKPAQAASGDARMPVDGDSEGVQPVQGAVCSMGSPQPQAEAPSPQRQPIDPGRRRPQPEADGNAQAATRMGHRRQEL